jgi:hypothetical protein
MTPTIELFAKVFLLTGESADPRDKDFTFYTHEKIISNKDGTPGVKEYYLNYDPENDVFSDLAVQCDYTYTYDADGTTLLKRVEDIEWFFTDGEVGATRQITRVFETA